jgi:biopolymer transport protein ExbB/TolQ
MQFSLPELWAHMGMFARIIVGLLAVMSVASLFVTGERLLFFAKSKRESMRFAEGIADTLAKGDLDQAVARKAEPNEGGHLGRTVLAGFAAYRARSEDAEDNDLTFESVTRALERQSQREVQNMKRGLGLLATISSTAPFVGLLGTVMGIVTAFQEMAKSGSGGLGTVSGGISEALVTTAFGLVVAIPAVMAFNHLQGWTEARSVDLSESANELLDTLARHLRKRARHLPQ